MDEHPELSVLMTARGKPRVAYSPFSASLQSPGDRRRFVAYARARNIDFEITKPGEKYDLVVLSEFSDLPYWSRYEGGKVVYELIDSYLAIPDTNISAKFRGLYKYVRGAHSKLEFDYKESVRALCRRADAVVCGTEEEKNDILPYCKNVHIILDVHATVLKHIKTNYATRDGALKLVWEGLGNNVYQLGLLSEAVRHVAQTHPLELHVVTDPTTAKYLGRFGKIDTKDMLRKHFDNVVVHPWEEATCAAVVTDCDLALIPIDLKDPFMAGKSENKLLLLWKMGMPAIASATPAYERAMLGASQDNTCRTTADWISAIEKMISSEKDRASAGRSGRQYASTAFAPDRVLALWDETFLSCGLDFRPIDAHAVS